jgi:diguanylate cyclase
MTDRVYGLFTLSAYLNRMKAALKNLMRWFLPPVPRQIRDDLVLMRYSRIKNQVPLLYMALMLTVGAAGLASNNGFPPLYRFGVPGLIIGLCLIRLIIWVRRRNQAVDVNDAASRVRGTALTAGLLVIISSLWSVLTWQESAEPFRSYVPVFMTLGALSSAYCLSSLRLSALFTLSVGLLPIAAVLFSSGDQMHMSMAASILAAGLLQTRLIFQHHSQIVDTLMLQHRMEALANTDMLTGLPNRRSFLAQAERALLEATAAEPVAIALLDLDGFKPVNDRLGHHAGDELLKTIADRMRTQAKSQVLVGRIGGDEFAILFRDASDPLQVSARATGIIAALAVPCTIGGRRISISASLGLAQFPQDGASLQDLMLAADRALYEAKAEGRSQIRTSSTGTDLANRKAA